MQSVILKAKSYKLKAVNGQILLETTIALGILVMGVFAVVGMSLVVLRTASVSGNRVIAVNLAREGVELVRLVRDTNQLDPDATWPFGLNNGSYTIDASSGDQLFTLAGNPRTVSECGTACELYLDANNQYTHTVSGSVTQFRRLVMIDTAAGTEIKRVVVEVEWLEGGLDLTYHLETHLSNWRED